MEAKPPERMEIVALRLKILYCIVAISVYNKEGSMSTNEKKHFNKFERVIFLGAVLIFSLVLTCAVLSWGASASANAQAQKGDQAESQDRSAVTVQLEFPLVGGEPAAAIQAADDFASLLSAETGLDVQASVQDCTANVVKHLGEGGVDAALLNLVGYVHGHDQYGIEAVLVNERYGLPYFRGRSTCRQPWGTPACGTCRIKPSHSQRTRLILAIWRPT